MFLWLKTVVRDALPKKYQVPTKYWYGAIRGDLEPEMVLLATLVKKGSHVADIGGNRGTYAYPLSRLGARLDVFEPNPICASILERWSCKIAEVTVHRVALSGSAGSGTLHIPIDENGVTHDASASIERNNEGRSKDVVVSLKPLDSFGFSDIEFIKIDTEGHEVDVLSGAVGTINASLPALLIEIEQRHHAATSIEAIFSYVLNLAYEGYFLSGSNLRPLAAFDLVRDQSITSFGTREEYINNFLFLAKKRLNSGDYRELFERFPQR